MMFSIILGILASILPNLLFAWLYSLLNARSPQRFIKLVYLIEGLKFAGLALLFSAFLHWSGLQTMQFFLAFVLSELARLVYQVFKLTKSRLR